MIAAIIGQGIVIIILTLTILYLVRQHGIERSHLLNRIMARDYNEFTLHDRPGSEKPQGQKNYFKPLVDKGARRQSSGEDDDG